MGKKKTTGKEIIAEITEQAQKMISNMETTNPLTLLERAAFCAGYINGLAAAGILPAKTQNHFFKIFATIRWFCTTKLKEALLAGESDEVSDAVAVVKDAGL